MLVAEIGDPGNVDYFDRTEIDVSVGNNFFSTNYSNVQPRWGWWVSGSINSGFHPELIILNSFRVPVEKYHSSAGVVLF